MVNKRKSFHRKKYLYFKKYLEFSAGLYKIRKVCLIANMLLTFYLKLLYENFFRNLKAFDSYENFFVHFAKNLRLNVDFLF